MNIIETNIKGAFIIENNFFCDDRGKFLKLYNNEIFEKFNLNTEFKESYFSISNKDVIRGMHFQIPPFEHEKLVSVISGKILDVIIDLRKDSKTYGKYFEILLSSENTKSIYIPKGVAHGFKSLEDNTIVLYSVTSVYNKECDYGIKYDSFNFNWNVKDPILSNRDKNFEILEKFLEKEVF